MLVTEDDKKAMALADAIKYLELSRKAAYTYGFGWEIDDAYIAIQEVLEFEE
jgi:ACT domain-containing protein